MDSSYGNVARIAGALFIIATVTALASAVFLGSSLDAPVNLTVVAANENQVVAAVILWLILAVSVIGIGFVMYPILGKHDESLALGYFGLRLVEAVFIVVASVSILSLLSLGQEYAAGSLDANQYVPSGALLLALQDWSFVIGTLIFLGLGGLPLNYLLHRSKLVPRWLSVWGLIGATGVLLYGLLELFGVGSESIPTAVLAAPIGVQEMVFSVWLVIKGFNEPAIDPESTSTETASLGACTSSSLFIQFMYVHSFPTRCLIFLLARMEVQRPHGPGEEVH
jgi:hypothetical protein